MTLGLRWFDVEIDNNIVLGGSIAGTDALAAADELISTPVGARRDELVQLILDSAADNYLTTTQREQSEDGIQSLLGLPTT
ncbi:hypothetical protein [Oceanicoccus sp. KOV_DT_Chl]|uniref:hypothetical protein n=1 Tax=Oceanicoccus sp. KOV_DT_Chl TaxID=1904639 RepID=UPI000C798041|nr:hypothetical protein [Oceanicoccus sp. KOV_DT_Chl]